MEVSFTHRLLYPQGKSSRYPLGRRLGGPQSRSGRVVEEKNSQDHRDNILQLTVISSFPFLSSLPYLIILSSHLMLHNVAIDARPLTPSPPTSINSLLRCNAFRANPEFIRFQFSSFHEHKINSYYECVICECSEVYGTQRVSVVVTT
jgi:hypothetical protein